MKRYTFNEARAMGEIGNTSSFHIKMDTAPGSKVSSVSGLNLIKNTFYPAMEVDYNQAEIKNLDLTIGPGIDLKIPIYSAYTTSIKVQFYDTDIKAIKNFVKNWIKEKSSLHTKRLSPANLKDWAVKLTVLNFDKAHKDVSNFNDTFYIVPDETLDYHGDQSFNLDTNTLTFNIVGVE